MGKKHDIIACLVYLLILKGMQPSPKAQSRAFIELNIIQRSNVTSRSSHRPNDAMMGRILSTSQSSTYLSLGNYAKNKSHSRCTARSIELNSTMGPSHFEMIDITI